MLTGGEGGPAIVPGKAEESLLVEMIEQKTMPPPGEEALEPRQVALLKNWISAGAPLKAKIEPPLETSDAERGISAADRQHWAFRPPVRPVIPTVHARERVRTSLDAFILSRLEAQGMTLNPDAPRAVLLRRLCFDLLGLPPTLEQLAAFESDARPDAYERLVESLLASPHFGERWGRHWLDVAGYADSDGFLEADRERREAWRYRDYVIRAQNSDKPYNEFIREQLAGDELTEWRTASAYTPDMLEKLIATGFLRTAADPTYREYNEKPEIYKVIADVMQITGSAFLGITVQCARCHDHKSEPLSQREYYRLMAVFSPAYDPDRWISSPERGVLLLPPAEARPIEERNAAAQARSKALRQEYSDLVLQQRGPYLRQKVTAYPAELREALYAALLPAASQRTEAQLLLVEQHAAHLPLTDAAILESFPEAKARAARVQAALAAETALVQDIPRLRVLTEREGPLPVTPLLRRGDFNTPGKPVEPGVPSIFSPAKYQFRVQPGAKSSGRRTAFADWLTHPEHPTTARLQVNRIWAGHFGRGLVETVDDFGHSGRLPSHPELLDWLATEFTARHWSQKAIHRLIVTSTVYRQSSAYVAAHAARDRENVFLWAFPPRRHQGETLRDSVLAVAGHLNSEAFGPPVPVKLQPDGTVVTAGDAAGRRRSIYLQVRRSQPVTLLELFDTPRMEVNCPRRTEALVATQSLALLNSPFMEAESQALAQRILRSATTTRARLEFAWKLLFSRRPSVQEANAVGQFLKNVGADSSEAVSTEKQASAPPPADLRAWSHIALLLLNSNEFLFID